MKGEHCRISIFMEGDEDNELIRVTKTPMFNETSEYVITGPLGVCTWSIGSEKALATYILDRIMLSTNYESKFIVKTNMMLPDIKLSSFKNDAMNALLTYIEYMKCIINLKVVTQRKDTVKH